MLNRKTKMVPFSLILAIGLSASIAHAVAPDAYECGITPDAAALADVKKNPAYQMTTYQMIKERDAGGHETVKPNFAKPISSGLICGSSSEKKLGDFLSCLNGVAKSGGDTPLHIRNVISTFEKKLNGVMKSDPALEKFVQNREQWDDFFQSTTEGFNDGNMKAAERAKAYSATMEQIETLCTKRGDCAVDAHKAREEFMMAISGITTPIAAQKLAGIFRKTHGIKGDVHACSDKGTPKSLVLERRNAMKDPIAAMFTSKNGLSCNASFPRVICHTGDGYDPNSYDKDSTRRAKPNPMDPLPPSQLANLAPVLSNEAREDVREFMSKIYLRAWQNEVARSMSTEDAEKAYSRTISCNKGGSKPITDMLSGVGYKKDGVETANAEDQKELRLQSALASACVAKLSKDHAQLQAKHGLGVKSSATISERFGEHVKAAKKNLGATQGVKSFGVDLGVGTAIGSAFMAPMAGVAIGIAGVSGAFHTPYAEIANLYEEKNKCAGMYTPDSPIYKECSASFTLMNQIGAEMSSASNTYPIMSEEGEKGATDLLNSVPKLPADAQAVLDSYLPGAGGESCVVQLRAAVKGKESEVKTASDDQFKKSSEKRLADLEKQMMNLCDPDQAKRQVDIALASSDLMARYFDCGFQGSLGGASKDALSCDERKKFSWVLCQQNLVNLEDKLFWDRVGKHFQNTLGTAMDAMAIASPIASLGKATLKAALNAGVFGGVLGGGSVKVIEKLSSNGDTTEAAFERERAKLAAGVGDLAEARGAQSAAEEFKNSQAEFLGGSPAAKAALEGFITGALTGAFMAHEPANVGKIKANPAYERKVQAQADKMHEILVAYTKAEEAGLFKQGDAGKKLKDSLYPSTWKRLKALFTGRDPNAFANVEKELDMMKFLMESPAQSNEVHQRLLAPELKNNPKNVASFLEELAGLGDRCSSMSPKDMKGLSSKHSVNLVASRR